MVPASPLPAPLQARLEAVAGATEGLLALALVGSRARREQHARSDWDFAVLGDDALSRVELTGALMDVLGADDVDVVRLERASGVLRFEAARDGKLIWEARAGLWIDFVEAAALFWCDAGPAIIEGSRMLLDSLGPQTP